MNDVAKQNVQSWLLRRLILGLPLIVQIQCLAGEAASSTRLITLDSRRVVIIRRGEAVSVDLQTGVGMTIARADDCVFDATSKHVLLLRREDNGTTLTLLSIDAQVAAIWSGCLRLRVSSVLWGGSADQFVLEAGPTAFQPGDVPFAYFLSLTYDSISKAAGSAPVPGISDSVAVRGGERLVLNPRRPGTFAYGAQLSEPDILLKGLREHGLLKSNSSSYLVVCKDWRPWKAWPSPTPVSSIPIAFSIGGDHLLVRLTASVPNGEPKHVIVDLTTGDETTCDWLSPHVELIAVARNLDEAIFLLEKPPTGSVVVDSVQPIIDKMLVQAKTASGVNMADKRAWLLGSVDSGNRIRWLRTFSEYPSLAGARLNERAEMIVTDGNFLWTLENGHITEERQIQ